MQTNEHLKRLVLCLNYTEGASGNKSDVGSYYLSSVGEGRSVRYQLERKLNKEGGVHVLTQAISAKEMCSFLEGYLQAKQNTTDINEVLRRLLQVEKGRVKLYDVLERAGVLNFEKNPHLFMEIQDACSGMWEATNKRLPNEVVWPREGDWPQ